MTKYLFQFGELRDVRKNAFEEIDTICPAGLCLRMHMNIETGFRSENGHGCGKKILIDFVVEDRFACKKTNRHASVATISRRIRSSSEKSPNIAMAVQGDALNLRIMEMASRS